MKSEKNQKTELFIWGILFAACVLLAFMQKLNVGGKAEEEQQTVNIETPAEEWIDTEDGSAEETEEQINSTEMKKDDTEEVPSGVVKSI